MLDRQSNAPICIHLLTSSYQTSSETENAELTSSQQASSTDSASSQKATLSKETIPPRETTPSAKPTSSQNTASPILISPRDLRNKPTSPPLPPFDFARQQYLAAADRKQFILNLIKNHSFHPSLIPLIAAEPVNLISDIAIPLDREHHFHFVSLLVALGQRQSTAMVALVLRNSFFQERTKPIDLTQIGRVVSDDNPLYQLWQAFGPDFFVLLHKAGVADARTLYLWACSHPSRQHKDFFLRLADAYAGERNFSSVVAEILLTERDIAIAQKRHWRLSDQVEDLVRIVKQTRDSAGLSIALSLIRVKLLGDHSPIAETENLIYIEFWQSLAAYFVDHGDTQFISEAYWRWLVSRPKELLRLQQLLESTQ